MTAPARKLGPRLVRHSEPQITHDSYERISPGPYRAYCRAARIYWDPTLKRWLRVLRWDILNIAGLNKIAQIPQWLYIGRKPHATRRAQYWREWSRAHGEPPARTDRMTARVFTRGIARAWSLLIQALRRRTESLTMRIRLCDGAFALVARKRSQAGESPEGFAGLAETIRVVRMRLRGGEMTHSVVEGGQESNGGGRVDCLSERIKRARERVTRAQGSGTLL